MVLTPQCAGIRDLQTLASIVCQPARLTYSLVMVPKAHQTFRTFQKYFHFFYDV